MSPASDAAPPDPGDRERETSPRASVPWERIECVLLDAGNTLVSIDFEWVRDELEALGVRCATGEVRRAEAAARPAISDALGRRVSGEGPEAFRLYLESVLAHLPAVARSGVGDVAALATRLGSVLRAAGRNDRLWSSVMPGVPETLERLRARGLRLAVVSNSDGSIEQGLERLGLRDCFDAVVDSFVVGVEKPDPRIFGHALARLGADPSRTLHVGDMVYADVVGARRAGIHAVLLDPFSDWGECDAVRLPDLPAVGVALGAGPGRDADG
jgi:putative hydrolase of the HAD superfamily